MTIKLIFVRHGESEDNVNKLHGGHSSAQLTKIGKEQAHNAAIYLKNEHIDLFYVSDLQRTKQTADPIIREHLNAPVIYEPRLREKNTGIHTGQPIGTSQAKAKELGLTMKEYRPENGESYDDLMVRAVSFIEDVIKTHQGKTVALISHGGTITNTILHLLKLEPNAENFDAHNPHNTAITILEIDNDKNHKVHLLNSIEHLN